jgi:hypothetical protein
VEHRGVCYSPTTSYGTGVNGSYFLPLHLTLLLLKKKMVFLYHKPIKSKKIHQTKDPTVQFISPHPQFTIHYIFLPFVGVCVCKL